MKSISEMSLIIVIIGAVLQKSGMFLGDKGVSIVAVAFKVKFCGVREDKCEI